MPQSIENNCLPLFKILFFTLFSIGALHVVQGDMGLNLADEGYLWYGVQRVLAGEAPIRDFSAYDPGRYYFSALLLKPFGADDIVSLRLTLALAQALGLAVGLWLVARSEQERSRGSLAFLLIAGATLLAWMLPRHKVFDISISISLIGLLALLVRNPVPRTYFLTGLGVGLAAFFGRNHGIYGAAASLGAMVWLSLGRNDGPKFVHGLALLCCGMAVGYAPMLVMALALPGFGAAFIDSIRFLLELGSTNLALPVPWPWRVDLSALPLEDAARALLLGFFFMALPLFALAAPVFVTRQRMRGAPVAPALVAAAFLAPPYAHYAFSRADIGHLALGIFPLLIGVLVLLAAAPGRVKWIGACALCAASVWLALPQQPAWRCHVYGPCVEVAMPGRPLKLEPGVAAEVALLRDLAERQAPGGRAVLVAPFSPGAYALLNRRAPVWEIYPLFSRSDAFQDREIERIEAASPGVALVANFALDGRDELRFSNTHARIYRFLRERFDRADSPPGRPDLEIFVAKQGK